MVYRNGNFGFSLGVSSLKLMLAGLLLTSCSSANYLPGNTIGSSGSVSAYTQLSPSFDMASFSDFTRGIWPEAAQMGISRRTFDAAFVGVAPDPKIIALTKRQSEFVKPIWDYLSSATSAQRIERGRAHAAQWRDVFQAVEARYGVDRRVIAGVWGMETNFGSTMGNHYVIEALATLAHAQYRGSFFRTELLTALTILEAGHISRDKMVGSWAGAMGQTQFMPSSFIRYAVDFDGDGRRDIWNSAPDALASTGNYLRENGWVAGLPWGFEVKLPPGYNYSHREGSFASFAAAGVKRADGSAMLMAGEARIFFPAGARGPAFLVTKNFDVIKRYNNSDAYALGVALLGDMVYGGGGIQSSWPLDDKPLSREERFDLQRSLARLGFTVGEPDGKIGTQTRNAIMAYQERIGLIPDGYPNQALLARLRRDF